MKRRPGTGKGDARKRRSRKPPEAGARHAPKPAGKAGPPRGKPRPAAARPRPATGRPVPARVNSRLPAARWWTPWLAGLGAVVWLFMLVNAAVPLVRCTSVWANKLVFLAVMVVPWYWLRVVRQLPAPRWRWTVGVVAVAGGLAGPVLAWRSGSWTTERREISSVALPAGGRVVVHEERSPGSLHYRMVARQEREVMPGAMVVRRLARHEDAHGGLVELLDPDTVRIRPARVIGEVPVVTRDLKPWAWW